MPIVEPAPQDRISRGVPLSQAAFRSDNQWLAIAWVVRNRAQLAAAGSVDAQDPQDPPEPTSDPGVICSGNLPTPDPTRGATHFHRHDEQPQWAASREPVALIGDFLFYRIERIEALVAPNPKLSSD